MSRSSTRHSLQSLPTLPSGRQIAYDHHRISDYNEFKSGCFDIDDEELDGYNGEDEMRNHRSSDGEEVDVYRGDMNMVDIETDGDEGQVEMNFDDSNEDLEPDFSTQPPVELMGLEEEDQSINTTDDESKASQISNSRKSFKSNRSKSTNDSIEVINLPLSNEHHEVSINEYLGNSYEKLGHHENALPDRHGEDGKISHRFSESDRSHHDREISPMHCEETESQWPGEEQPTRQSIQRKKQKKKLTPAKKRRRCILAVSLVVFCLGTAGAGVWFVFFYLKDKRGYNIYDNLDASNAADNSGVAENPGIEPIGDMFDSGCAPLTVEIKTDRYGNETSWRLVYLIDESSSYNIAQDDDVHFERQRHADGVKRNRLRQHHVDRKMQQQPQELTVGLGGPYVYRDNATQSSDYNSTYCLTKGSYRFDINDANGDGFCCKYGQGYYRLYFSQGRDVHTSSFESSREETTIFDVTDSDIEKAQETNPPSISVVPSVSYVPSVAPSSNINATSPPSKPIKIMSTLSDRPELSTNISTSYGFIFDIKSHHNISSLMILGIDLLVNSTDNVDYEVWSMSGSWQDINTNETAFRSGFDKVANGTLLGQGVCDNCGLTSIPMEEFQSIFIRGPDAVHSLWIMLSSASLVFQDNSVDSSCDSFQVNSGSAVFVDSVENVNVGDLSASKGFLGVIYYQPKYREIVTGGFHPTLRPVAIESTDQPSILSALLPTFNSSLSPSPTAFNISNTTSLVYPTPAPSFTAILNSTTAPVYNETLDGNYTIGNATAFVFATNSLNETLDGNYTIDNATAFVFATNSSLAPSASFSSIASLSPSLDLFNNTVNGNAATNSSVRW